MIYERFAEWLDCVLDTVMPKNLRAFCFNLYEEENQCWSVELIGSNEFDDEDAYWASMECFDSREYPCRWQEEAEWEDIYNKVETCIRQYLVTGRYAGCLKAYQAVAMGFVDGDLNIVYKAEGDIPVKNCPVCGKDMQAGEVKAQALGSLLNNALVSWYPEKDKGKFLQKNAVELRLKAKGYYCSECMKVFAVFEEK